MRSDHYYTGRPASERREERFEAVLRGARITLLSDAGVFSKKKVDKGTRLLIEAASLPESGPLLDLGCGYGPIGLALARLMPEAEVYMVDINERAVELARRAAELNGIENVRILHGDGFDPLPPDLRFQAILTNPPYRAGNAVVFKMIEESARRLEVGGTFTCVGRTRQGAKTVRARIEESFGNVTEPALGGGYRVMEARRLR